MIRKQIPACGICQMRKVSRKIRAKQLIFRETFLSVFARNFVSEQYHADGHRRRLMEQINPEAVGTDG